MGRIFSVPGLGPLTSRDDADRVLNHVQGELARGEPIQAVLAQYLPSHAKPHLVETKIAAWLDDKRDEVAVGDRSPTYLRELERYAKLDGHFSWWHGRSIFEIDTATVDDWSRWLRGRGLSPKTRKNILGAFRVFVRWLRRREEIDLVPQFPAIREPEHSPHLISLETQDQILAEIPDDGRGIYLALTLLLLRPGEARALDVQDVRDGWVTISKACKGLHLDAPIRETKTGMVRRLPLPLELEDWLERHLSPERRLRGGPLFLNPRTSRRFSYWALRDRWCKACSTVGVRVPLYDGTKHTGATEALRRGVKENVIQAFLGHADARTTRRYAKLSDQALVTVLRPRATSERQGERPPE